MRRISSGRVSRAFTLIELLVVVAIIGLLISILLPSLRKAREQAKTAVCASDVHQLSLATIYYSNDNAGRMPLILGSTGGPTGECNAPYRQFYQLILFFKYMPDRQMFRCPSATDSKSVKSIYGLTSTSAVSGSVGNQARESLYFVRKSDPLYELAAPPPLGRNYWPEFDPFALGGKEEFPELYTEYWFNDFHPPTCNPIGKGIPHFNGGVIDKIPAPNYAVPIAEWDWASELPDGTPDESDNRLRHGGKMMFGFLDGHAETKGLLEYYDNNSTRPIHQKRDMDAYNNRPFFKWGLSKAGTGF